MDFGIFRKSFKALLHNRNMEKTAGKEELSKTVLYIFLTIMCIMVIAALYLTINNMQTLMTNPCILCEDLDNIIIPKVLQ